VHEKLKKTVEKEWLLLLFLAIMLVLALLFRRRIPSYPSYIDWSTIVALAGLLVISTGIKQSGYLEDFAVRLLSGVKTERGLAFFLSTLSAIMAMFVTNDVTLFIVVPLTLSLQEILGRSMVKTVVVEALAVNAGSSLTPIGNPQNIFLWQSSGVSFLSFALAMLPVFLVLFLVLLLTIFLIFPAEPLTLPASNGIPSLDRRLFSVSSALLLIFIVSVELGLSFYSLPAVLLAYLFIRPSALKRTDWPLLMLFMVMFIDFRVISDIPAISDLIVTASPQGTFGTSILLSQVMSNVPATIFLSNLTDNWRILAWGANVGGSGLAIGSLASIIALRLYGGREIWKEFHRYSMPYLFLTALLVLVAVILQNP